jgi:hypothetical protein
MHGKSRLRAALLLLTFCLAHWLRAQIIHPLQLSSETLDFGDVLTSEPGVLNLGLTNTSPNAVAVLAVRSLNSAFEVADTTLVLEALASVELPVRFSPRHNIPYDSELLLLSDALEGHLAVDVRGRGVYPDAYYATTQDLSQEALKNALRSLIGGHTSLGYTPARDEMYMVIDNQRVNGAGAAVNTLETCYTGRVVSGYVDRSDAQTNDNVNTEHTWPQSAFSSAEPMQSDLFHLFIADANANSIRGNLPFGYVSTPDWSAGGSKRGSGLFEVRDAHKGRTARAVLYFYLRYGNLGSYLGAAQETALRQWHRDFAPEIVEQRRNAAIYLVQDNRNPLIDHPEFDERISSYLSTAVEPELRSVVLAADSLPLGVQVVEVGRQYAILLAADGNRPVTLSHFRWDCDCLTPDTSDAVVLPGQSLRLPLTWTPETGGFFSDTLRFRTDADDSPELRIALSGFAAEPSGLESVQAHPSWSGWFSAQDALELRWNQPAWGEVSVFSPGGQLIGQLRVEGNQSMSLPLSRNPASCLLLGWKGGKTSMESLPPLRICHP